MKNNRRIGFIYEKLAKDFLVKCGYRIVCTNFYSRYGEIDIVAYDENYLCFIEVKYRGKNRLINGFNAVNKVKQNRIRFTSKYYLYKHGIIEEKIQCRYDVISITDDNIELLKNAF